MVQKDTKNLEHIYSKLLNGLLNQENILNITKTKCYTTVCCCCSNNLCRVMNEGQIAAKENYLAFQMTY